MDSSSLPAYHLYSSPERFKSRAVTSTDHATCEADVSESAESVAAADVDTTNETLNANAVYVSKDAEDSVSWRIAS